MGQLKLGKQTLSASGRLEIAAASAFSARLRRQMVRSGLITRLNERLAYDLGDIHWIFKTYAERLRMLIEPGTSRRRQLGTLKDIQRELYLHLPYHLGKLRRPLARKIAKLDGG